MCEIEIGATRHCFAYCECARIVLQAREQMFENKRFGARSGERLYAIGEPYRVGDLLIGFVVGEIKKEIEIGGLDKTERRVLLNAHATCVN